MPAPERRTRLDVAIAVLLTVLVVIAAGAVWWRSDARATVSEPALVELPALVPAPTVPTDVAELWRAPSAATGGPVVAGGAVVSADGSTVQGHDPVSGRVRWTYSRDLPLCTVAAQFAAAVAVYETDRGCSEVTAVRGSTGERGPQRSSDADDAITLVGDGTYLAAAGSTRTEVWRSDLVRTLELGRVDAPVVPDGQTRTGCTTTSVGLGNNRLGVVLECPDADAPELVLLDAAPDGDARVPVEQGSVALEGSDPLLLAVTAEESAVFLPTDAAGAPQPRVAVVDSAGALLAEHPVDVAPGPTSATAAPALAPVARTSTVFSWFVDGTVIGLSAGDLRPVWTLPDALGPGVAMADLLVVPVLEGLAVLDPGTGAVSRRIPVDRAGYDPAVDGPVLSDVAGSVLLERRGAELVALG